ncbi:MAG: ketoacyl-ACP synthase III [Oscillospiraceae bacterium]|nr:ketoacyl-ACP synthase III [Oscillospiraceae bacterium]
MAFFLNHGIKIAGIATAVPDNPVPVESFTDRFGEEAVKRFSEGTGIRSIYNALPDQTASDLACAAAEELFSHEPVDREQIGVMVFVTQSPDYRRPSSACILQKRLALPMDCACVEVELGCSGFVYGLQTAMSMMASCETEYGLLLIGETASKLVDPMDKSIVMMYGDAGAAILLKKEGKEIVSTLLKSDGSRYKAIVLPAGGFRDMNPGHERFVCSDGIERSLYDIFMDGTSVFSFSISDVPQTIREYYAKTGTTADDYDVIVLHQANQYILKQVVKRIKAPAEKVPISIDRFGNTGGISIPLTLCDRYGEISDAGTVKALMSGFGIGLSWGVTAARIDTAAVYPIIKTDHCYMEGRFEPGKY